MVLCKCLEPYFAGKMGNKCSDLQKHNILKVGTCYEHFGEASPRPVLLHLCFSIQVCFDCTGSV